MQLPYLLCLLFEYAAALGLIDVAYIDPAQARADFRALWGTDELRFLSCYDGLAYFRINALGAYALGMADTYASAPIPMHARLSVLPSLHARVFGGALYIEETLTLETRAHKETYESWRLDREQALNALERRHDIEALHRFLQERDAQPLPHAVEAFMRYVATHAQALKPRGMALLIECDSAETAATIATRKETASLCLRAGERYLAVRSEHEKKLRKLVWELRFGMVT